MANEKMKECMTDIYVRLFREATPPLDYKKFLESVESGKKHPKDRWFMKHYLSEERQIEIMDDCIKRHKIKDRLEKEAIQIEAALGHAPSSVQK